jgi:glycosyltransferase involved in cell wall biosynthesis
MLTVTYLVTVYNKERYIPAVISSLKATQGKFKKEFIFINDGSIDNSLSKIQSATSNLGRVTIINQANQGPSISTNVGIKRAKGDYIHFVDGDDIISSDSTSKLLDATIAFDCDFAFSIHGTYNSSTMEQNNVESYPDVLFIEDPIKELARGKISQIRSCSGALIKTKTLMQVEGCDEEVFIQDFSLALRCARLSKFIRINQSLYYCPEIYDQNNLSFDKNFEKQQSLLAMHNFLKANQDLCQSYLADFYKAFWSIKWKIKKDLPTLLKYIESKIIHKNLTINNLIELYSQDFKN